MRFWDTSGLVLLLVEQEESPMARELFSEDPEIVAWWGSSLECASAAARLRRERVLSLDDEEAVLHLLSRLREGWLEILPSNAVRDEAARLLRRHPLRAADALQLGAAIVWAGAARNAEMVTLDERLALATRLEGFRVVPTPVTP